MQEPAPRRYDSPRTDWPWWLGIAGLFVAIAFTLVAVLIVDGVASSLFGVHITEGAEPPGAVALIDTILQDALFVIVAVMLARSGLRKVSSSQFGLRPTPARRAALLVLLTYVIFFAFSTLWAVLLGTSTKEKLLEELGAGESTSLLIASAALTCVIAPICEEFLFRGLIFTSLRKWRGPWPAAVITGLIFGAVHGTSAPLEDLLPLAFLGFSLCVLYRLTGSLYPCIAAHAVNNVLAFGSLESWGWQIPVLLVASLCAIYLLMRLARRIGLIADAPASLAVEAAGR
ncbi:MAG TPA: type II CAAX endopeptidase family protein [Solirubrobacteraceae bacterium]|jgi:hypothetical protein